jgi:hypothetical protein
MTDAICPICKSKVKRLDKTGDAEGFDCPKHKPFKVAGSVFSVKSTSQRSPGEWEKALSRAKQRAKPGEWPLIQSYDFDG